MIKYEGIAGNLNVLVAGDVSEMAYRVPRPLKERAGAGARCSGETCAQVIKYGELPGI
jgi:hypothetical protein